MFSCFPHPESSPVSRWGQLTRTEIIQHWAENGQVMSLKLGEYSAAGCWASSSRGFLRGGFCEEAEPRLEPRRLTAIITWAQGNAGKWWMLSRIESILYSLVIIIWHKYSINTMGKIYRQALSDMSTIILPLADLMGKIFKSFPCHWTLSGRYSSKHPITLVHSEAWWGFVSRNNVYILPR